MSDFYPFYGIQAVAVTNLIAERDELRAQIGMVHAACIVHDPENQCVECRICRAECNDDEDLIHRHDCPLAEIRRQKSNTYIACGNCQENISRGVCPWPRDPTGESWAEPCPIRAASLSPTSVSPHKET